MSSTETPASWQRLRFELALGTFVFPNATRVDEFPTNDNDSIHQYGSVVVVGKIAVMQSHFHYRGGVWLVVAAFSGQTLERHRTCSKRQECSTSSLCVR